MATVGTGGLRDIIITRLGVCPADDEKKKKRRGPRRDAFERPEIRAVPHARTNRIANTPTVVSFVVLRAEYARDKTWTNILFCL